jgi:hypothetical protein
VGLTLPLSTCGGCGPISLQPAVGLKNVRAHLLPLAMVTAIIVIGLFTIKSLEYPFSGDAPVKPSAFELVLNRFEADSQ